MGKDEKGAESLSTSASILVMIEAPKIKEVVSKIVVLKSFTFQITSFDTKGNMTIKFGDEIKIP